MSGLELLKKLKLLWPSVAYPNYYVLLQWNFQHDWDVDSLNRNKGLQIQVVISKTYHFLNHGCKEKMVKKENVTHQDKG